MPNTLAHFALHSVIVLGARYRIAVVPLVVLTTVIPDVAWILQRLAVWMSLPVDSYLLRAYAISQGSLFVSLLLAAGCSAFFHRWGISFVVLGLGCGFHLVLDATQIKWSNGVTLFAPFDWKLYNWGLVWPEHWLTHVLTVTGILACLLGFRRLAVDAAALSFSSSRMLIFLVIAAIYLSIPMLFLSGPRAADNHYISTLVDSQARPGKVIEFDRRPVFEVDEDWFVQSYADEIIGLNDFDPPMPGTYSIRGIFETEKTILVREWHHHGSLRDIASIIGLFLAGLWFVAAFVVHRRRVRLSSDPGSQ